MQKHFFLKISIHSFLNFTLSVGVQCYGQTALHFLHGLEAGSLWRNSQPRFYSDNSYPNGPYSEQSEDECVFLSAFSIEGGGEEWVVAHSEVFLVLFDVTFIPNIASTFATT